MRPQTTIPQPPTQALQTEKEIAFVKFTFKTLLCEQLHLHQVQAPIAVLRGQGINDDLSGREQPVSFPLRAVSGKTAEVVQSLAKWKRLRLADYELPAGEGILTDMRALRPCEAFSSIHSVYVDQWDWEQVISPKQRQLDYLKATVRKIYTGLRNTEAELYAKYPQYTPVLPKDIRFIQAEELLQAYPGLSPKAREHKITKKYGAVFLIGIGGVLSHGEVHDYRAPDYDDWTTPTGKVYCGLNGDILLWNPVLEQAFELSSMGIRVDAKTLRKQLDIAGNTERENLYYHKRIMTGDLPQTIGGGIGQSRLVMFLLQKQHIGEVQVGIWPDKMKRTCTQNGISLL